MFQRIKRRGICLAQYKLFWKTSCIISVVLALISVGFSFDKIKLEPFSGIYQTIIGVWPDSLIMIPKLRPGVIVWLIISISMYLFKEKYYLISIRSLAPNLENIDDKDIQKNFRMRKIDIDVSDTIRTQGIKKAIEEIDDKCSCLQRIRGDQKLGFYGIAHIPFLFRIGYYLGDQSNIQIFHKSREYNSIFMEWASQRGGFKLQEPEELNFGVTSEELIVAISTSFEIKTNEIDCLDPHSKHILLFKGNTLNFDAITSYKDAEEARTRIMEKMRELVKAYDIQKIHLVIASSAAFTFFLGMAYSRQHDPECIVYHYERPNYPWGISIKKTARRCIVRTPLL